MAFATVAARQTGSTTTNAATHTVTFPAGVAAGELLLAFVAADGNPILDDSAGRWAKIGGQHRNGTVVTGALFAKIAEGSDTLTVRTRLGDANQTQMISWVTMRISSHGGLPVAIGANGSSTNSNPPAITPPWGSQDYLWIAARMGDGNVPATAAPSGYSTLTGVTHSDATNGACVHTAEKSAAASTEDPGTFTSATEQWAAFTVAVPPSTITTPQLVASYETFTVTSATTSIASPSFTPADGELIVVSASTADMACVPSVPTATGVTFTSRAQAGTSGSFGQSRVSTAKIGTSPGAITVTQAFTGSGFVRSFTVERWKNAKLDATPAVAQATGSGGPSTTVTTEAANSVVSYVCTDWNAIAPGAYLYRGTHTIETSLFDVTTTDVCSYYAHQHAPTAGSQTLGLSVPVGQAWSIAGIEIQYEAPAAGGGVSVVGTGEAGGNDDTLTIAWPDTAADDVAILVRQYSSTSTPTEDPPTGFSLLQADTIGTGHNVKIYTRVCDGNESGTIAIDLSSGVSRQLGMLTVYRGLDPADPIGAVAVDMTHAAAQTYSCPSITLESDGSVVATSIHERSSSVNASWTPPSGYTEQVDTESLAFGSGGMIGAWADDLTTSRSANDVVTPPVWTGSNATGTTSITTYTYELKVLQAPGGTGEITARTATVVENQTSSIAPDTSTGQTGDCVVLTVACDQAINTPSGWTACFTQIDTVVNLAAFYRFLDGSASDDPTVTTSSGTRLSAICQPFGGVDTTTPLDVTPATTNGSSSTSVAAPSVDTVTAGAVAVSGYAIDASSATYDSTPSAGWTEISETTGTGRRQGVATKAMASPGATGICTWTQTGGALQMVGFTLALRPAPAAGGGFTPRGAFFPFMYG